MDQSKKITQALLEKSKSLKQRNMDLANRVNELLKLETKKREGNLDPKQT